MVVLDNEESSCEFVYNDRVDYVSQGTGDVFASSFVGSVMVGKSPTSAEKVAGEFTKKAIEKMSVMKLILMELNLNRLFLNFMIY